MIKLLHGDCRDVLKTLSDESVHCVVTSPPYWGLRDYGTATWEGGDAQCDHRCFNSYVSGLEGGKEAQDIGKLFKDVCGKCGARRIDSQIGLEPDFNAYIATMVGVFREVRRVLRSDGTLWLNLGDSYASAWACKRRNIKGNGSPTEEVERGRMSDGLKEKDLCGIPWRVALALQADGWWLRQDIIWSKPNPMPESVTDRCTKAHEYIFLMSKSARYYYDAEAIAEVATFASRVVMLGEKSLSVGQANGTNVAKSGNALADSFAVKATRNKRSVWEVATAPFSEAHFATFPPALIEPCIKAGCPAGGVVLDPFGGAGTTGLVADRLQRNAILIELNPDYATMTDRRVRDDAGMFAVM